MSVEIVSAPTEAENYLYALLQDESGIDLAEFCYIDERNQEGGGIFRAYPFQVPWYRDRSKLHVDAAGRCIMEGQLVLTSTGWVPIQYVRVGDLVLTHMNRWRPVTHVWDRGLKTTVLVRTVNQPNELICTPDHEVWADSGDVQDWVHASDLAGTALASPSGFETVDGPYSDLSLDLQNALSRLGKEETLAGLQFSARDRRTYLDIQLTAAQYGFSVNAYRNQEYSSINGVVVPALECHHGKVWTQVQKVYPYGVRHVWDLTVEEDSSFVCEGYVVHNSIGKALDVETPMLTSKGWTTMGELVEGDQLFTERGKLTTVTKAHKVLKNRECFSVTFSDDSSIVADADHLWTVYTYEDILHADRFGGNAAPQIKTTKEILENLITTVRDDDTLELSELPTYRVPFVDKLDLSNTNLSNKDLYLAQSRLGGHIAREIVSVEPVKSRPVRCIEVDNATKIFLAGSSLIPTHNSMSIILRGLAFPFAYPGEEMMITAPEHIHLQAVWDKLEKATLSTRLSREFLKGKPQHRPYQLSFQNNARIMGRIPQKTGAGLQGCVEHNTLILTEGGYRPAKDIQVGERVWSHEGRWTEVLYNGTFEAEGYEVSGAGALPVIINDAHRFFGVRSIDHNPKRKIEYGEPEWLDFRQLSEERCYWALPRMEGIPSPVDCAGYTENEDEAWLLGLYAADGYLVSEKGSMGNQIRHRICFVAHPSNHAEIIGAIERLGLKVSVKKRSNSSADILEVSNKSLAIKALSVGSNAKSKSVPAHILFASIGVRRAFFEGYMFGDGGSDERGRKASTTISQLLSAGIRHLALSLGYSPSISMYQPLQTHVKGVRLKSTPQLQYRSKFSDVISAHHDADYIYGRIKPAMRPVGLCTFADLVTGDHSYVSNGVLSHNTHPLVLELDEAGNFPESAWVEVRETLEDRPGATWRCIAEDQLVLTRTGWVAIKDISVGDSVWTHRGRWRRVSRVWDNGMAECVEFKGHGVDRIVGTDDHKFFTGSIDAAHEPTFEALDCDSYWHLTSTCGDEDGSIPEMERVGLKTNLIDTSNVDWLWLYGLFIADGYTVDYMGEHNRHRRSHWCVHNRDVDEVISKLSNVGISSVYNYTVENCTKVTVSNANVSHWLDTWVPKGAHNKDIAEWVFQLEPEYRNAVFDGLVFGDGWRSDRRICYTTTSRKLALNFGRLARSLGYSTTMRRILPKNSEIDGRVIRQGVCYEVTCKHMDEYVYPQTAFDDYGLVAKVKSVTQCGKRHVYDIEVEDDHSYCVEGVFVSNCHGVSFGYGSTFNKLISGDDPHWTVRKLPSMNRPTWSDTVRQERIAAYGGYDSDGYRRNVLGLTSDPSGSPLFVMNRLYACVDSDAMSDYNTDEYYQPIIQEAQVRDIEAEGGGIEDLINIPVSHMAYKRVWIASDLGWTISPTSITVFAEVKNDEGKGALKLISRILLHKISAHDQMRVVMFLMDIYQPQCYALDATGAGFVLWDIMLEEMGKDPSTAWMRERVKDINFSSKVIVGFDNSVKVSPHEGLDGLMRSAIMQPFVVASTDQMRKLIDDGRMILPFDEDLLQELQDPTIKGNKISSLDAYGKSGRKKGMHNLDAMRMAVHSYESRELDLMMSSSKNAYAPPPIMFG